MSDCAICHKHASYPIVIVVKPSNPAKICGKCHEKIQEHRKEERYEPFGKDEEKEPGENI